MIASRAVHYLNGSGVGFEPTEPQTYCSGDSAGQEFVDWTSNSRVGKSSKVLYCYFDKAFDQLCERIGLSV